MKKHSLIIQFFLAAAFLFAVLYPSLDGFGHLEDELESIRCKHQYAEGKNEINHSHHELEKCFVCEFTFSQFLTSEIFSFSDKIPTLHSGYTVSRSKEIAHYFRGSLFSLRGPPSFIA